MLSKFPDYARISFEGYDEQRESAILRTEMEDGPVKQARVRSLVLKTRTTNIIVKSREDYIAFESWFINDLNEGTEWFEFTDPLTHQMVNARFTGEGLQASPITGTLTHWQIKMRIETLG